ncbi:MAG: peptidylprolyl isomerase [Clostridia bacterium]
MKKTFFAVFLSLSLLILGGCGEKTVAEVNGESISYDQFEMYWENLSKIYEANDEVLDDSLKETVVEQLVYDTLLEQTAKELDCLPSGDEEETYYKEQMADNYGSYEEGMSVIEEYGLDESFFRYQYRCRLYEEKIMACLGAEEDMSLSDKEARELYDADPSLYDWRRVSRILVTPYAAGGETEMDEKGNPVYTEEEWAAAEERCTELAGQLKEGSDFSELAVKYSDDVQTAGSGGRISETLYQDSEGYDEAFLEASFDLTEEGDYTQKPVRTGEGFELLFCDDVLTPQRMDEVISYIKETQKEQRERSLLTSCIEEKEEASEIVYHREVWE